MKDQESIVVETESRLGRDWHGMGGQTMKQQKEHQRPTFKERIQEEIWRQTIREPKEKSEPLTDEAWFFIIFLLSIGIMLGLGIAFILHQMGAFLV